MKRPVEGGGQLVSHTCLLFIYCPVYECGHGQTAGIIKYGKGFGELGTFIHPYLMWLAWWAKTFGTRAMPTHTQFRPLLCTLE